MSTLEADLRYRADRMRIYGESFTDWVDFCADALAEVENAHDECPSSTYVQDLEDERDELTTEVEGLREQVAKLEEGAEKRLNRSKLQTRIKVLEDELSYARNNIEIYKQRIEKGATPAKLSDLFIFSPEEARAQFRAIDGGAA